MGADVVVYVDDRGAVYLGAERYLAGEQHPTGSVSSYVPGHVGTCSNVNDLVSRWGLFRLEAPSYDAVTDPTVAGESPLADAQRNTHAACESGIRNHLRDKLGRNKKQSERARKTNEAKRRKKEEIAPW